MKKKILVFPCGSEIALEIQRSLAFTPHVELVGASSVASNHGPFVFRNYNGGIPPVGDPYFIEALNSLIEKEKIELVFPAHDDVVLELSLRREALSCPVIGSPAETCLLSRSKKKTYERFKPLLRVPRLHQPTDARLPFPLFLKPDRGQGSRGTRIARSRGEVDFHLQADPSLLLMECLTGPEYTVDCFTDRRRKLRFVGARERVRTRAGISVDTRPVGGDRFRQIAEVINGALEFRGPWFFQVKESGDGELVLMEIAPRIAGGMGLHRALGVNLPLLGVYDDDGLDVQILANSFPLRMDRALFNRFDADIRYRHVYVDLDDCLVMSGEVNRLLVIYLLQCRRGGIRVHLLSRTEEEVKDVLPRFGLEGLFDSVTVIDRDTPKSAFITERDSIFIDDSFSERAEVKKNAAIPVFAPDAVECLVDWRR